MRVKTSVSLPADLLDALDEAAGPEGPNRSRMLEVAAREYLERRARERREVRDRKILNAAAAELNREMAEVLEFQAVP
jgi:metal-responsive CopG/Arc/MetJ family transcriptional regulator